MTRRFLVTAALPYANNRPHVGHVAGVYLPADVYVRYLRMMGDDVVFVCGSDDYGVPVTISAQKEGSTPAAIVAKYRKAQVSAFGALDIVFDIYSGTSTCAMHPQSAQEFFRRILARGDIAPRDTEQFYCTFDARFLPDRYVEGTCPYCGATDARGDQCDRCGRSFEQTELLDPRCATCGRPPEIRKTRHWFFKLESYHARLKEWLEAAGGWRDKVRNSALGILKEPLPERSITRDLTWGVPVPLPEAASKVLYVWFDAPIGYLSFTQELFAARGDAEGWRPYWQDSATRLVHFLGKDNIIFHAIIWPAMLMGEGSYILPSNIPANEHLHTRGEKLSKSRGNAIWVEDVVGRYGADRVRYYLTAIAPEGRDTSFAFDEFTKANNEVLSDVLGNLCHRVFTFAERYLESAVPAVATEAPHQRTLFAAIRDARDRWRDALEAVRLREAQGIAIDLAREGNRFFDAAEPWKTRKSDAARCATDLRTCLELVATLAVLLAPYLPQTSARLCAGLGLTPPGRATIESLGAPILAPGARLTPPGVLFPKLEEEVAPPAAP